MDPGCLSEQLDLVSPAYAAGHSHRTHLFHLTADWCREYAEQKILFMWMQSQPGGEQYSLDSLAKRAAVQEAAGQPFQEHPLQIDFGYWPVTQLTRDEFRSECKSLLESEFEAFCDRIENLAIAAGMERTPEKRELDHFCWLARNLLKGESAADISRGSAKLQRLTARAVSKAIEELAKDLELTPRKREGVLRNRIRQMRRSNS
jgi:hypothetical protein